MKDPAKPYLKCYDSVTLDNLPADGDAYLAYVTGWPEVTPARVKERFPHAVVVSITTNATFPAKLLDIEAHAGSIDEAVEWWHRAKGVFHQPGFYASLSNMNLIQEALRAGGIKRTEYVLVVADWNGVADIPEGYNGHQYLGGPGLPYDTSVLGHRAFGH